MSRICLCMIVRDESAVIERCLTSVRPLIDSWVICDTGSRDGTPELIERALEGIPGALHHRPWVDFGHNRSEAMALARGTADYLLLLDADMTVELAGDAPDELTADSYLLRFVDDPEYWLKALISDRRPWKSVGSTHEFVAVADGLPERQEQLDGVIVTHHADGGTRGEKLERDARLLARDMEVDANNVRTVFYLAQTYRDLGQAERSIELYDRRATMGGWAEEVFYSLYQSGVLRAQLGDWPSAMASLIRAWEYRPARLEPLYELAWRLRERQEYETAHLFAARGVGREIPADILFLSPWVYRWGMLFEFSITAYWTGDAQAGLRACRQLLAMPDLPPVYREQTKANRQFCAERVGASRRENTRPGSYTGRAAAPRG
jgi:tetratricopeptide (TPR) repeat protein